MAEGSNDDNHNEFLIELVRARPVLFSKKDKNFKDSRTVKKNNWEDVARETAAQHPNKCGQWTGKSNSGFAHACQSLYLSLVASNSVLMCFVFIHRQCCC